MDVISELAEAFLTEIYLLLAQADMSSFFLLHYIVDIEDVVTGRRDRVIHSSFEVSCFAYARSVVILFAVAVIVYSTRVICLPWFRYIYAEYAASASLPPKVSPQ